uniref:NADH dehydrogenase subunit 5 n=1 Tax=Bayerotrochus charlestonensis TaxID=3243989 RepID=UPI001E7FF064|nr:NADH dehydrogenase subunit 5 [Perotrochus charlestonensis]UDL72169.1 NADH dehydrogenase subunit 5 [Perotrochus charlestonensis]
MKKVFSFFSLKSSSVSSTVLFMYSISIFPVMMYFLCSGKMFLLEWEILSVSGSFMSFPIILDPVGLSFSFVVCFISACVMLFSSSYMSGDPFLSRFIWLVMMFVFSMNMLIFIPSLISLLLGWDGLGIVSFALVIYYQNMKSMGAGMLTALANRVGDVMLLISIGLCVVQGHWNILFMWDTEFSPVISSCILVAGMTKSAQIPFSAWLPAAMAAPTPVSALVHSSTLVTAGVFLLIRFFPFLNSWDGFKPTLMFFAVTTLLMAGVGANYEHDLKKVIALSTLSQLGVMMLSLSLGMPYLALFHLYTHALFKAMLFLCAGGIIHNNSNMQDIRSLGNLWSQMPLTVSCLNVANLALCGAPFMSGFYSKDMILEYCLSGEYNFLMLLLIFLATGMTAAYSLRLSVYSLWGQSNHFLMHQNFDEDIKLTTPVILLSLTTIISGKYLQSFFLEFNESLILPMGHKLLTLSVIVLGFWVAHLIWANSFASSVKTGLIGNFMSSMWFLAPSSTQPIILFPLSVSLSIFKSIDQGWLEVFGGQGLFFILKKMFWSSQKIQSKMINSFVVMTFISLMVFIVMCLT